MLVTAIWDDDENKASHQQTPQVPPNHRQKIELSIQQQWSFGAGAVRDGNRGTLVRFE